MKKTKYMKRLAALFLSLVMVITYIPATAFAAGGDAGTGGQEQTRSGGQSFEEQLAEALAAKEAAEAAVSEAEALLEQANADWQTAKAEAAEAVEAAQKAYDGAGRAFINKKINDNNGHDLDEMIAACKTYTDAAFASAGKDADGNTYATVADAANSDIFEQIIDLECSYENLKKDAEYIREANAHRNLEIHNAGTLSVSYQLMGTAMISNAISVFATGHNLVKGDTEWNFWQSGNSMRMGENLAYSPVNKETGWDPFHGWYYDERIAFLAQANGTQPDQALVDQVLAESEANGFVYNPYGAPWNQSQEFYLSNLGTETGHYESLINSDFKATGFAYVDGSEFGLENYSGYPMPCVAAQEFNGDTAEDSTVWVDDYEDEIDSWFAEYKDALDDAEAAAEAAKEKPQAVADAEAVLEEKNAALEEAAARYEGLMELQDYFEDSDIAHAIFSGVPWRITDDGRLLIGQEGKEYSFEDEDTSWPWTAYSGNISSVKVPGTVHAGNCSYMFGSLANCTSMDLSGLDTSGAADMGNVFNECLALNSLTLGEKSIFTDNPPFDGWTRCETADGTETCTPAIDRISDYDGSAPGTYCSNDYLTNNNIDPHDWDEDYTVDQEATYDEEGWESIHCSRCDATKDGRVIPAGKDVVGTITYTPAKPYQYYERYNGYEAADPDTGETYYVYNMPWYTLGDVLNVDGVDYMAVDDPDYGITFMDAAGERISCSEIGLACPYQSAANPWTVGNTYNMTVTYKTASCVVPITIVENPVKSISFTPKKPYKMIQNYDGWERTDWETGEPYWYYNIPFFQEGDVLTVNGVDYIYSYNVYEEQDSSGNT